MHKPFTFLLIFLVFVGYHTIGQEIEKAEPPFWWVEMNNPELQLLIYGKNIEDLTPDINAEGVKLKRTFRVSNPNYLFLDLTITNKAQPGKFDINFKKEGETVSTYTYELKDREKESANREGFNNSDAIYLITPDRFANGNPENDNIEGMKEKANRSHPGGRHGGDIQGIIDNLDYIHDMGFTAIWLNPVLENDHPEYSYHGYSTTDYYKIDRRYGSNKLYRELSKKAKDKGMKLIMDMIPNHCGSEHWWIKDPPMDNWVHYQDNYTNTNHQRTTLWDPYASEIDRKEFEDGWFVKTMPDLNQQNPMLANYLVQNAIWWIEYADLDGIRVDTYPYAGKEFMKEFTCKILNEYPDINIVGEEWTDNPAIVSSWQKGKKNNYNSCLPSVMDFPTQSKIAPALVDKDMIQLYRSLANDFLYSDPYNLVVFADNHDMSRFYTQIEEDLDLFKMGMIFVSTVRGIPQYFYGTEVLMANPESEDHGIIRSDFPGGWKEDEKNAFTGEGLSEKEKEAQKFMKELLNWRKEEPLIHEGKLKHYLPENELYVYFRYNDSKSIMIAFNKLEDESQSIDIDRFKENMEGYSKGKNVLTNEVTPLKELKIPPESAVIIELLQ
ncbi:MAG: glycoside hydrolase family 13 protein [Bacteroidales bacterium]